MSDDDVIRKAQKSLLQWVIDNMDNLDPAQMAFLFLVSGSKIAYLHMERPAANHLIQESVDYAFQEHIRSKS